MGLLYLVGNSLVFANVSQSHTATRARRKHLTTDKMEVILKEVRELKDILTLNLALNKENLNFEEGCLYTNRSRSIMYKLTSGRKIPHYKDGKFIWFKRSELDDWLLRSPVKTLSEIESQAATYVALT